MKNFLHYKWPKFAAIYISIISIPEVLQTPPETVKELLREILRFHYTGLKCVKEYPKVEKCCVWCLNRTRLIEESIASWNFTVTVQQTRNAA